MKSFVLLVVCAVTLLPILPCRAVATDYYVAANGADDNPGTSPELAWKTLGRVNSAALQPGDSVLFRRGDVWRGSLRPKSGGPDGVVRYADFGEGPKPLLLGSVSRNRPEHWRRTAPGIWTTGGPPRGEPTGEVRCLEDWHCHTEAGAATAVSAEEDADSKRILAIRCVQPGARSNHIQLSHSPVPIAEGKVYRVRFRAACTVPVFIQTPTLMKSGPPWTHYSPAMPPKELRVDGEWKEFERFYVADTTSESARLTFFLGDVLPEGAVLRLAEVTFAEVESNLGEYLSHDVGNIIFDGEASCGVKVWEPADLKEPGRYWYDEESHTVSLCCEKNPAEAHTEIECALRIHIIDQSSAAYVTYENLALKYGAAHGIGGAATAFITVRNCDFGYIGGGDQRGGTHTVRFGNGVEFWHAAHDCLVEGCRLWEIYDAALTNQASGPPCEQVNIVYRNNVIWNCEYSFEYWNRPEASLTKNVVFENNVCMDAGAGWGHTQRPDPSGRHLCFYASPARAEGIVIRDNVFYGAAKNAFYAPSWSREAIEGLALSNNVWWQPEGVMVLVAGESYPMVEFARFQAAFGFAPDDVAPEKPSLAADPMAEPPKNGGYRLLPWVKERGIGPSR